MKYWVIRDWAGNYPFEKYNRSQAAMALFNVPTKRFESFDDAEEFLSIFLGDSYEENRQEYEIEEKTK